MKPRSWLRLILTLTLAITALLPVTNNLTSPATTAFADAAAANDSHQILEPVPLTDRVPWLVYVVLTSSSVALAWILFSLARARMRDASRDEEKQT